MAKIIVDLGSKITTHCQTDASLVFSKESWICPFLKKERGTVLGKCEMFCDLRLEFDIEKRAYKRCKSCLVCDIENMKG